MDCLARVSERVCTAIVQLGFGDKLSAAIKTAPESLAPFDVCVFSTQDEVSFDLSPLLLNEAEELHRAGGVYGVTAACATHVCPLAV